MKSVMIPTRRGLLAGWLACWAGLARSAPPDAILGSWLTDDGASKVEVTVTKAVDGRASTKARWCG